MGEPARVFPGQDGLEAFFRDQGDWSRLPDPDQLVPRQDPVLGLAEFAARIAQERGGTAGLAELFGPSYATSMPFLSLNGWETPLGAVFQVHSNGNHRLGALAALGVPCVLAEVTWIHGPFDTSSGQSTPEDELRRSYRLMLHTFGVASYPDPLDFMRNDTGVISEWPILIDTPESACASLRAMEALTGREAQHVGRLPRSVFDDPDRLLDLGKRVQRHIESLTPEAEVPEQSHRPRHGWLRRR